MKRVRSGLRRRVIAGEAGPSYQELTRFRRSGWLKHKPPGVCAQACARACKRRGGEYDMYVVKVTETVPGFSEETPSSEWPRDAASVSSPSSAVVTSAV